MKEVVGITNVTGGTTTIFQGDPVVIYFLLYHSFQLPHLLLLQLCLLMVWDKVIMNTIMFHLFSASINPDSQN